MDYSSEANFDKEAGSRIEFSEQSVSQMEENMNNKRLKYTQVVFPHAVLLISQLLFFSLPPICPCLLFSELFYMKKENFQKCALSTRLSTIPARTAANLHLN